MSAMVLAAAVGFVTPRVAADHPAQAPAAASAEPGFSLQQAVQQAFAEVLPDQAMHFALDSSQSSPVEGGGERFDGSGIGTFDDGEARFVAFTLTLSASGELVEFDYSTASPTQDADQMAAY